VFLNRLKFGFLLFETQQGFVRVELSFWQRVYLLWTFRNFRQLTVPLLNSRQRALVTALFASGERTVSDPHDPDLSIGMVEDFLPPTPRTDAALSANKELQEEEKVIAPPSGISPNPQPTPWPSPKVAWSRMAAVAGVLVLCVISVVAWHRIERAPRSEARNQSPPRINAAISPDSSHSAAPSLIDRSQALSAPAETAAQPRVTKSVVQLASTVTVTPVPKARTHIPTPASTPDLQLSVEDDSILASRPPVRSVYPVYPDVNTRGAVALTAQVDSDGRVRSVRVVSGNHALASAAVRAVRLWRYSPYLEDGRPVATETNIVISFISEDTISMTFPPSLPLAETQLAKHAHSDKLK